MDHVPKLCSAHNEEWAQGQCKFPRKNIRFPSTLLMLGVGVVVKVTLAMLGLGVGQVTIAYSEVRKAWCN